MLKIKEEGLLPCHYMQYMAHNTWCLSLLMQAIVQSFLEFGYHGLKPRVGGYDWQELHQLNDSIAWQDWASCVLEQHTRGDLDLDRFLTERAMRRRQSSALQPGPGMAAAAAGSANGSSSSLGGPLNGSNVWLTPQGAALDGG
jgi:hypothetical protein